MSAGHTGNDNGDKGGDMNNVLYVGSDNLLEVDWLKKSADGSYINNAAVTCTIVDANDVPVAGETWPVTLVYVPGSNGKYQGAISSTAALAHAVYYTAKFDAVGAGYAKHWEIPMPAVIDPLKWGFLMEYPGDERRSDISRAIRIHEERERESFDKLHSAIESITNDVNENHILLSDQISRFTEWKDKHEIGDKAEHDRFFAELASIKNPVIDLKNAIEGMGTISRAVFMVAKLVASVGIIAGGLYAMAHYGGGKG